MPCSPKERNDAVKAAAKILFEDLKAQGLDATNTEMTKAATAQAKELLNQVEEDTSPDSQKPAQKASKEVKGKSTKENVKKASEEDMEASAYQEDLEKAFGSTIDSKDKSWNTHDLKLEDVHGNIFEMRNLLKKLHTMGGEKETDSHFEYLDDLLGSIDPEFLTKMTTYVDTQAKHSSGIVKGNSIGLKVGSAPKTMANQQSDAEIYVHEVIHSLIQFALRDGSRDAERLRHQVQYTMDQVMANTTWEDFMPDTSINLEAEQEAAKKMFDYIFLSENAEDEFMAHALTNPIVMEVIKGIKVKDKKAPEGLWNKIKSMFDTLVDIILGHYEFGKGEDNAYDHTKELVFKLAELNKKTVERANSRLNFAKSIWDNMQKYNRKFSEVLEDVYGKYMTVGEYKKAPKQGIPRAIWMAKLVFRMLSNNDYRKAFTLVLSQYGIKPTGDTQSILRDFHKGDERSQEVDMMALQADKVDTAKNNIVDAVSTLVHVGFKDKLSKEQEEHLTKVLIDTDLGVVYKKIGNRAFSKLLRDPKEIDRRIHRVKHKLLEADKENYKWNANQAHGLGYFMVTGKAHMAQNFNAWNIGTGVLAERRKPNYKAIALIDELASLTALKYTDKEAVASIAALNTKDGNGVKNVMSTYENFKKEAANTVFKDNRHNIIKGYSREIFDNSISMIIAPVADESQLYQEGYVKKFDLPKHSADSSKVPMAMYTSNAFDTGEYYRTATRITSIRSKGTSVSEAVQHDMTLTKGQRRHKAEIIKMRMNKKMKAVVKDLENGTFDIDTAEYGISPQVDQDGFLVDFRYMMDKDIKEEYLGLDNRVSEVLSKSYAHTIDKAETESHNRKILDHLLEDMKNNYSHGNTIGANNETYVIIKENSNDPDVKELLKVLPPMFKQAMNNNEHKELAVRGDLFHAYFGYRHMSIANAKLVKMMGPTITKILKIAEKMWMEFIKIAKVDILIKMPVVIIGNIISNVMYGIMTGTSPAELIKEYTASSRDVTEYFKNHKELTALLLAKKTGNIQKSDLRRIPQLQKRLEESSIHELAELGIYQSIVEDMGHKELESTNKIKKMVDDKLNKTPQVVKQGINWLYLTDKTGYFKVMNEMLTKSDLIARDIENRKLKRIEEKQANGKMALPKWYVLKDRDKLDNKNYKKVTRKLSGKEREEFLAMAAKVRHEVVLSSFVNYNKASGRVEEYLNKMGFIMFTKYAKRIQRVIGTTATKNPFNVMMAMILEGFTGDIETIYDQSIFTKNWYNLGLTDGDSIPGTNPLSRVIEVMNPPLVQLLSGDGF